MLTTAIDRPYYSPLAVAFPFVGDVLDFALLFGRCVLAATFGLAGVAKLADRTGSRQALVEFGLPTWAAPTFGVALPLIELTVATALLLAATAWWGAIGSLTLLAAFLTAIGFNLARGRRPDCHCFGQLRSEPIGKTTVIRNVVLAGVAGLIVWRGPAGVGPSAVAWLATLTTAEAALLAAVVVLAVAAGMQAWFLGQLFSQHGRLLARIETLEARPASAAAQVPQPAAPPQPVGLPIGAPAPAFSLPDLEGRRTSVGSLRGGGASVLLVFMDPDCGPCGALIPDAVGWSKGHADRLMVTVISRGKPETNRKKFANAGLTRVLLQEKHEVGELYSALGTPSAVLVRPNGRIGSAVATGADAIRALVAQTTATGNGATAPPTDATVGARAKGIRLPDLAGRFVQLADYRGRDTLVLFWNPACGFCQRMLPDLKAWEERAEAGTPQLFIVSTGTVEANRAMALRAPIGLDQEFATGRAYAAGGTPSAVLIDASGRIASGVAVGAEAVLALARPVEAIAPVAP